jgi:hypothetical protein
MKTRLSLFIVLSLVVAGCQSPKIVDVNAPTYNCLFSTNCIIVVNDTTSSLTNNLEPMQPISVGGFLQSRTFQGQPGTAEAGNYGYEYRLVLNQLSGASSISIDSMKLDNFGSVSPITYNGQPNNKVWVVTSGGLGSVGPTSAAFNGSEITFNFSSPLTFVSGASQESSSYFYGMASPSPNPPSGTASGWATFSGTVITSAGVSVPILVLSQVRTPP